MHRASTCFMSHNSQDGASASSASAAQAPARLPLTSADPVAARYEQLKALFPMAVTDGRPDLEKLRAVVGEEAARGPERYGLSWAGKSDALRTLRQLTTATLLPAPSESVRWDTTGNAIVEGDNLEVLKVLQHAYHGKVKLIYIDPPYNTGGDFIYPDDYAEGLASYQRFTRQVNEDGVKLTTNVNTSGRYHSRWLTMIYPRLFLARNLLREDGVIFVSIDDHEVHNLRMVMDEIFGEENFLGTFVWRRRVSSALAEKLISTDHEYVVAFQRQNFTSIGHAKTFARYSNPDDDPRGPWIADNLTVGMNKDQRPNQFYSLIDPETGKSYPANPNRVWAYIPESMSRLVAEKRVLFPNDTSKRPMLKRFKRDLKSDSNPVSTWAESVSLNTEATREIQDLFGESLFSYSKPTSLVSYFLKTSTASDDLVLDFFAGSGTTAQAVLELNKEDGGNRKFILVQLPEPTGRADFPTIAEITKERVRRVIRRMESETAGELALAGGAAPDLGFKVFKLAPSNFAVWDPALAPRDAAGLAEAWQLSADNVRGDVHEQALLHELMLKCGLPLTAPVEAVTVDGVGAFRLDGGRLVICLARTLTREVLRAVAELRPQSVLCLDVGFRGDDALKVNAQLEFQSHGIQFRTA
jgi:adenine-specific DNA-methyltransferase